MVGVHAYFGLLLHLHNGIKFRLPLYLSLCLSFSSSLSVYHLLSLTPSFCCLSVCFSCSLCINGWTCFKDYICGKSLISPWSLNWIESCLLVLYIVFYLLMISCSTHLISSSFRLLRLDLTFVRCLMQDSSLPIEFSKTSKRSTLFSIISSVYFISFACIYHSLPHGLKLYWTGNSWLLLLTNCVAQFSWWTNGTSCLII